MHLVPDAQFEKELKADYELMKEMFFGEPESLESILNTIREIETALNRVPTTEAAVTTDSR